VDQVLGELRRGIENCFTCDLGRRNISNSEVLDFGIEYVNYVFVDQVLGELRRGIENCFTCDLGKRNIGNSLLNQNGRLLLRVSKLRGSLNHPKFH
jgi:hypothetical protein